MNSKQITTTNHNTPPSPLQLLYTIFKLYSRLFIDHSYVALAKCNISQQINHFIWDSLPTFYSEHWKITIVQTFKRCTLSHIQCSSINWTPNRMINSLDQIWNTQPFLSLTNESVTEIVSYNIFFCSQCNIIFLSNETASRILERYAPLRVSRELLQHSKNFMLHNNKIL